MSFTVSSYQKRKGGGRDTDMRGQDRSVAEARNEMDGGWADIGWKKRQARRANLTEVRQVRHGSVGESGQEAEKEILR